MKEKARTRVQISKMSEREIEKISERAPEGVEIGPDPRRVLDNSVRQPSDRVTARTTDETDDGGDGSA